MKRVHLLLGAIITALAGAASAQAVPGRGTAAITAKPVVVESYYRVKWGTGKEFKRLYDRNEVPLLREMQRQGLITDLKFEVPFTHMAGGPRWDFRARISYRDAMAAVEVGGSYDKAFEAARARLRPNKAEFDAEQSKRMALLEDHWDVIVTPDE